MANFQDYPLLALRGRVVFPDTSVSFDVGRMISLAAVKAATEGDSKLFVCAQKESEKDEIGDDDVYTVGTVIKLKQIAKLPGSSLRLTAEGLFRAVARQVRRENGTFIATVEELKPVHGDPALEEAYFRTSKEIVKDIGATDGRISKEGITALEKCSSAEEFVNMTGHYMQLRTEQKQELLECRITVERLKKLDKILNDELELLRLERKINASVRQSIDKNQKEYYLREQLKAIHKELGDDAQECDELEEKIKSRKMSEEAENKALKELSRMKGMQTSSPDYNVLRTYIDWMLDIPWTESTDDTEELSEAVRVLNADHYGLEKIKERITEYFAVLKRTGGMNAPILCFVGPPGVGKTSIASSIAGSLKRKFVRMSFGGVKDEAEVRGHRKTYVGSMPGRIISGMKKAGSVNPVFLLDEVDKISADLRGDPADALLEVLDPAQNSTFVDRYIEIPYDLSKVLFITTANSLDTIPAPLKDRMEIIELTGYTPEEKREIAKRYLVPKRSEANGLKEGEFTISDKAVDMIIDGFTMEAGVRGLERQIDAVCRKAAVKLSSSEQKSVAVDENNLYEILGSPRFDREGAALKCDEVGAATGLAWTAVGGTTLTIEVSTIHGKGDILLTGKLGDVMKESARTAISYIRSNSESYGIDSALFENTDIHIHVPEGATPKDGPSAGITMATAILSAFTQKPVKKSIAMTGEITLRGKVLPIGGLKEKALAAYRIGIRDVIIPADNKKDLEDVPETVRGSINFIPVSDVDSVFKSAIIGI